MNLSVRAVNHGPLTVTADPSLTDLDLRHGVRLARQSRVVAVVKEHDIADLLVEGAVGLRFLVEALSAEWDAHAPLDQWCRECGKPVPCPTRQRMTNMLVRNGGDGP